MSNSILKKRKEKKGNSFESTRFSINYRCYRISKQQFGEKKKGGGGEEEEKRGEWNGRRGGGEGRKRSWKGWTHWPGIKVPVPPSDALDHLGVDRGVGSRRP